MPNIRTRVSDRIAVVLSNILLWFALCNVRNETYLPQGMTNSICTAYAALQNDLAEGDNPIYKIFLMVAVHEGVTYLDEMCGDNDSCRKGGYRELIVTRQRDQILEMNSEMSGVRRDMHQFNIALEAHRVQQRK